MKAKHLIAVLGMTLPLSSWALNLTTGEKAPMVSVASHGEAMVKNDDCESLDCLQDYFEDLDLIITEGYKRENKPKIEVLRAARHAELICKADQNLIAVVTDVDINPNVPKFGLEDIKELADLIEETFL